MFYYTFSVINTMLHCAAVWQHSSNSNIKIVHNSIEHFLWNPSDFFPDNVLSCLWIVFTKSETHWTPIQVFCSRNEAPPHFSNRTIEYLRHNFLWDRLISRQTDNPRPFYSQDLNPPDYFLRGNLENIVRENNPQAREDIIRREIWRIHITSGE